MSEVLTTVTIKITVLGVARFCGVADSISSKEPVMFIYGALAVL
jgi:hypothetical protein